MGTAGGPALPGQHPSVFFFLIFISFLTTVFQTLRCLGFLPPRFSSHLPTFFSSFTLLPCLSHTGSFPAHLPKLHICSSLSRWFRAEMRKLPYPFHWLCSPPTLFRFKSKM